MSKQTKEALQIARARVQDAKQAHDQATWEYNALRAHLEAQRCKVKACADTVRQRQSLHTLACEKHVKSEEASAHSKVNVLSAQYNIPVADDSDEYPGHPDYEFKRWVSCPEWIDADEDPVVDGHFAYSWLSVLTLVEVYAKHHPNHPDHANREFDVNGPDN